MKQNRSKTKAAALREDSPPYHADGNGLHNRLRFIDLFCGIGGFRFAFERAGCECVFSSDWNKYAQQTYAANFGGPPHPTAVIDAQSVVPQHRERIFLVGFKERCAFEFPKFPAQGPKLESILETDVPDKYTLTDHLWN